MIIIMIEKFNGIIYLIVFLVHFVGYAFYAFRCLAGTKAFVDQYGMGDGAAIMTRFFGSFIVNSNPLNDFFSKNILKFVFFF